MLSDANLYILACVYDGIDYGYAIIKAVEKMTNGDVSLSPATLYRCLTELTRDDRLAETSKDDDPRRVHYKITQQGIALLRRETEHMHRFVAMVNHAMSLPHNRYGEKYLIKSGYSVWIRKRVNTMRNGEIEDGKVVVRDLIQPVLNDATIPVFALDGSTCTSIPRRFLQLLDEGSA